MLRELVKNCVRKVTFRRELDDTELVERFHQLWWSRKRFGPSWHTSTWLGVECLKNPCDAWIYQEIICRVRPDLIIETGTAHGGSALFFASLCDLLDDGRVITVDLAERDARYDRKTVDFQKFPRRFLERIDFLEGSSVGEDVLSEVERRCRGKERVMVFLDSDHRKDHVLQELHSYSRYVTLGSLLVVEDSNLNGHPVDSGIGDGPFEALEEFLDGNTEFEADRTYERFLITHNPNGYLVRIS